MTIEICIKVNKIHMWMKKNVWDLRDFCCQGVRYEFGGYMKQ